MSWLNELKKIFIEKEVIENKKTEMVTLEQIYSKVDAKIKEDLEKKKELKREIINRINQLEIEIKSPIGCLKKINLSERKEQDRIKLIVTENLNLYTIQLERLVNNLKNIENMEAKESTNKLFFILNDFNRTSHIPFEKATILIGKELQTVKEIINNFLKDIDKIVNNKELFEKIEISHKLSLLLSDLTKNKSYEEELNKKKKDFNEELKREGEGYNIINQKIDTMKNSLDYKKDMQEKEEHKERLNKLENELQSLRQKINFKLLAKYFHHDNKKIPIILGYADNFKSSIKNDNDLMIVDFAKEAQGIELGSLGELRSKIINNSDQLITQTDKYIAVLEANLKELDFRIIGIRANIENESKKMEKLMVKRKKMISEVKNLSKPLFPNIEIV